MPDIDHERRHYDEGYQWPLGGHEWSEHWYSAPDQWVHTIYRRIFNLLPTKALLEIGPGMGRWTPHLLNHCAQYIGVDIAERCVSYCRRTFGQLASKPRFLLGDGLSLASIADGSVSFVFTVDSLIHADRNCILAYAPEIHRVLEPGGHAFVHHSNLGEYVRNGMLQVANPNRRDSTLDAREAARIFSTAGLTLLVQETFQWCGGEAYSDCFTLMSKPSSAAVPRAPAIFKNERFGDEIKYCHFLASIYTAATQGH